MPHPIHYSFVQNFNFSARTAFEWCTDFTPRDTILMQEGNAAREVKHVSDENIILTDTYAGEGICITKKKLVCLYPERSMWTSTHLTGPNKHSQFLYEIIPQTRKRCCLKFTALHLDYSIEEIDLEKANRLGKDLKKIDSETWKLLASKMQEELAGKQPKNEKNSNLVSSQ